LRSGVTSDEPNLIFVGLPGAGKTTTGRAVAKALNWPFIDFDTEIEHRQHASVQAIFAEKGEPYFRQLEQELSRELVRCRRTVMSAGGGWITNRESVALLRPVSRIIYLRVGPERAMSRLAHARVPRPLLQVEDPQQTLERLYDSRRQFYEEADLTIDTEVIERKELIEQVRQLVRSA
jgi:shikimate kinase